MYGIEAIHQGQGWTLMAVGCLVVFSALVLLILMMKSLKYIEVFLHHRIQKRTTDKSGDLPPELCGEIPGLVVAAFALTLIFEEEQIHDEESLVLTLQAMSKPYSNWWMREFDKSWQKKKNPQRPAVMQAPDPLQGNKV